MCGFETLKNLVAAGRERECTAIDVVRRPAPYSYHKFSTNVWKAGNLLGHYGVHAVGELAVAVGPKVTTGEGESAGTDRTGAGRINAAEPLLAILGGTILGATVDLTPSEPVDAPALVAPANWQVETIPGCTQLAYGGPPTDPDIGHFERSVWSENPIEPPEPVDPTDSAVRFEDERWTHEELLTTVGEIVTEYGLDAESEVVLDVAITEPGGLLAGVLAPLAVGGTVVVPENGVDGVSGESTLVVTENGAAENELSATAVTQQMRDTRRA